MTVDLNQVTDELAVEDVGSLDDFFEEPSGAWPSGWYVGEILEGYTTAKGKTFLTEDAASQKGDSRNLRICVKVEKGKDERTLQETYNYRPTDLTAERKAFVKEAREEYKAIKGRWPDADAQRSSLALVGISMFSKLIQGGFKRANGALIVTPLIGLKVDVKLGIDEKGFNKINFVAAAGSKTVAAKR